MKADIITAEVAKVALEALTPKQHAPVNRIARIANKPTIIIRITITHISALNPELPFWTIMTGFCC